MEQPTDEPSPREGEPHSADSPDHPGDADSSAAEAANVDGPHSVDTSPDEAPPTERSTGDSLSSSAQPDGDTESPIQEAANRWKQIVMGVKDEYKRDHVPLLGAGVAFYALLAIVPSLVAVVSIYGMVASPTKVQQQISNSFSAAPAEVQNLLQRQLTNIVETDSGGLGVGVAIGIAFALWSASKGMKYLISAINAAYNEKETRGFFKLRITALVMTVGAIAGLIVAFGTIAILPPIMRSVGVGSAGQVTVSIVRWPLLGFLMLMGLSVLYRYAPDRGEPHWSWVGAGSVFAVLGFLAASLLFSVYTANFATFGETYGSLGSVVVVMLWLMITATVIILGAEINAVIERQTTSDAAAGAGSDPQQRRDAQDVETQPRDD